MEDVYFGWILPARVIALDRSFCRRRGMLHILLICVRAAAMESLLLYPIQAAYLLLRRRFFDHGRVPGQPIEAATRSSSVCSVVCFRSVVRSCRVIEAEA